MDTIKNIRFFKEAAKQSDKDKAESIEKINRMSFKQVI
jgi:hypothetical protein